MTHFGTSPAAGFAAAVLGQGRLASFASPTTLMQAPRYDTIDVDMDTGRGIFWCWLRPTGRSCFSLELLGDIATMHGALRGMFGDETAGTSHGTPGLPRYFVCGSAIPGVFNLGGDLGLFQSLIAAGDHEGLRRYGHACVQAIHNSYTALELPMVSIALVQGDALGGGFECALAHDLIVAERSAKFGLPEVLFNLFPGMGAYSFLSRRIGRLAAERMILSGRIHTAEELHEIGLVDVVAPDGEGVAAVQEFVDRNDRWHNARLATYRARRRVDPVTMKELLEVVEVWADAAMRLGEQDLRRMARLVSAQDRRRATAPSVRAPEPELVTH